MLLIIVDQSKHSVGVGWLLRFPLGFGVGIRLMGSASGLLTTAIAPATLLGNPLSTLHCEISTHSLLLLHTNPFDALTLCLCYKDFEETRKIQKIRTSSQQTTISNY